MKKHKIILNWLLRRRPHPPPHRLDVRYVTSWPSPQLPLSPANLQALGMKTAYRWTFYRDYGYYERVWAFGKIKGGIKIGTKLC